MDCSLLEIPFLGPLLTWSCGSGSCMVFDRLGRGVVNSSFFDDFPINVEKRIVKDSSNHLPILFSFCEARVVLKRSFFSF